MYVLLLQLPVQEITHSLMQLLASQFKLNGKKKKGKKKYLNLFKYMQVCTYLTAFPQYA